MKQSLLHMPERAIPKCYVDIAKDLEIVCSEIRDDIDDSGAICTTCLNVLNMIEHILLSISCTVVDVPDEFTVRKGASVVNLQGDDDGEDADDAAKDEEGDPDTTFAYLRWKKSNTD